MGMGSSSASFGTSQLPYIYHYSYSILVIFIADSFIPIYRLLQFHSSFNYLAYYSPFCLYLFMLSFSNSFFLIKYSQFNLIKGTFHHVHPLNSVQLISIYPDLLSDIVGFKFQICTDKFNYFTLFYFLFKHLMGDFFRQVTSFLTISIMLGPFAFFGTAPLSLVCLCSLTGDVAELAGVSRVIRGVVVGVGAGVGVGVGAALDSESETNCRIPSSVT